MRSQQSDLEQERHRTIVHQCHLHVGAEAARLERDITLAQGLSQRITQLGRLLGWRGGREAWPVATRGIGGQGKLRHQQNGPSGLGDVQVHFAFGVGEHPVAQQALGHAGDRLLGILRLNTHQQQKTVIDFAHDLARHGDRCLGNALQQTFHEIALETLERNAHRVSASGAPRHQTMGGYNVRQQTLRRLGQHIEHRDKPLVAAIVRVRHFIAPALRPVEHQAQSVLARRGTVRLQQTEVVSVHRHDVIKLLEICPADLPRTQVCHINILCKRRGGRPGIGRVANVVRVGAG